MITIKNVQTNNKKIKLIKAILLIKNLLIILLNNYKHNTKSKKEKHNNKWNNKLKIKYSNLIKANKAVYLSHFLKINPIIKDKKLIINHR